MTPVTLVSKIDRIVDKLPKCWHIPHEDSLARRQKAIYPWREIERWRTKEKRRSRERTDKKSTIYGHERKWIIVHYSKKRWEDTDSMTNDQIMANEEVSNMLYIVLPKATSRKYCVPPCLTILIKYNLCKCGVVIGRPAFVPKLLGDWE